MVMRNEDIANIVNKEALEKIINKEVQDRAEMLLARRELAKQKWWKVLRKGTDGKYYSDHGGSMEWNIPTSDESVEHNYNGNVQTCQSGLHITSDPSAWLCNDDEHTLHRVDVDWENPELKIGSYHAADSKIAVSRLRIYGEANAAECVDARIAYRKDQKISFCNETKLIVIYKNGKAEIYECDTVYIRAGAVVDHVTGSYIRDLGHAASVCLKGGSTIHSEMSSCQITALQPRLALPNFVRIDDRYVSVAMYGFGTVYVYSGTDAKLYVTDHATAVFRTINQYNAAACVILRKHGRAMLEDGTPLKAKNADKYKITATKSGHRKIVER